MANIFAILTAVVLAISGFLAFKNQGNSETEGAGYRGWILKRENMEDTLARAKARLKKLQTTLAETNTTLAEFNAENETKTTENAAQKKKNEQLKAEVAALEAEGKAKTAEADDKDDSIKEFGDVKQVVAELKQLTSDLSQIELDITQGEANQADLEAQLAGVEASLADVRERISWRVSGESNPNAATRIRSVYATLGFVTLAGGDDLGIVKNSTLEVVRDDAVIANLKVTTVESKSAAADIVPDSVVDGESVQVGDTVRSAQKAAPEPEPAAVPALNPEPLEADPLAEPEPEPEPAQPDEADPFG
ncbi:MAG: hypothetical protein CMP30_06240 [Roseibacillus sp.]|nr:hypothetical protein [Roseibacillus sp.]HCQ38155.1 hypothetical protein [Verrucomicrobiales bacterium]|tara:strand:- start:1364 stop:2281 length:918 start_codon:yes stop_codon:yes gene_type:complete